MRTLIQLMLIGLMVAAGQSGPAFARASRTETRKCMGDCRQTFFKCLKKSSMKECTPADKTCRKQCQSTKS